MRCEAADQFQEKNLCYLVAVPVIILSKEGNLANMVGVDAREQPSRTVRDVGISLNSRNRAFMALVDSI